MRRVLWLACVGLATISLASAQGTTGRSADPFQPLLDHLEEHGGWSNDNEKVAKVFHRCVDAIPKDQDKAIIRFVGDNDNRAYWVADYLVEPVYLGGHTPRPYLALAIWADSSERLAAVEKPFPDDEHNRRRLNTLAAILAKRLGFNSLAVTFKKRAEAAPLGGPATHADADRIYDSIDTNTK